MTFTKRTDAPLCLILLPDALIAHDLKGIIAEARPDLQVLWGATQKDVLELLASDARIAVAFVALPPEAFANTALAARMASCDGTVVYLDHEGQADQLQEHSVQVESLRFPFVIEDVQHVLQKAKPPHIAGRGLSDDP